jgi:hypothetical protein
MATVGAGIAVSAGTLDLDRTVITGTGALPDGTFGVGLQVGPGSRATVRQSLFDHNRMVGVSADSNTEVTLTDVVVRDTQSQASDQHWGRGLHAQNGAQVTVERSVFDHNRDLGISVAKAGTELTLSDVLVKDTQSRESDGQVGDGLRVQAGARATVQRTVFDGNRSAGISGSGAALSLSDVVVAGTQPREADGEYGVGAAVLDGATFDVSASRFEGNRVAGILVLSGGQLGASSCEVTATRVGSISLLGPDGETFDGPRHDDLGDGILVAGGSSATLTNVRIADCARAGLLYDDSSGSFAQLTSTANGFGLVLQGALRPSYDPGTCELDGNREQSLVSGGALVAPNGSPPL